MGPATPSFAQSFGRCAEATISTLKTNIVPAVGLIGNRSKAFYLRTFRDTSLDFRLVMPRQEPFNRECSAAHSEGAHDGWFDTVHASDRMDSDRGDGRDRILPASVVRRHGKGLEAIKAAQQARHRDHLLRDGLPAVVNDLDVLTGAVTISTQWTAEDLARKIKAGDRLKLLDSDRRVLFEAPVAESRGEGVHQRILLAADPATMIRLRIGDEVRVLSVAAK
jgi:hypothetical protein